MTGPVLRRLVDARVHGVVKVPMALEYRTADPVAIGITLGNCVHRCSWHVARTVIRDGLAADPYAVYDECRCAGAVIVSRFPATDVALLVLRTDAVPLPVTVPATDLRCFLAETYRACPPEREAQLVARELDMQIKFFHMTNRGDTT